MTDYPDWQVSASTQSGNVFAAFSQVLTPGNHPSAVTAVYSWESLAMTVVPSAGAAKVSVSHYADLAGTLLIGTDTWGVNATTSLTVRVPLRGPYAKLSINVTSAGNLTANTWGVFQTQAADRISFPAAGQILFDATNTLAALASKTYVLPQIAAGRTNWCFVPFDATGMLGIYVQAVDELGNIIVRVSSMGNPTGIVQLVIEVPDQILQVIVQNTDAGGPHSYGFSLVVPPQ
jgi:phosphoheptose isomerase